MLKSYAFLTLSAKLLPGPCYGADFVIGPIVHGPAGPSLFSAHNFGTSNTLSGGTGGIALLTPRYLHS